MCSFPITQKTYSFMTLLWLHVLIISVVHTKSKSMFSSRQHANLQRTALLYMKRGGGSAPLTCSCLYLMPKYPHKYRGLSFGWTPKQGTLFLWGNDRFSLDWGCVWLLWQVCFHTVCYVVNINVGVCRWVAESYKLSFLRLPLLLASSKYSAAKFQH